MDFVKKPRKGAATIRRVYRLPNSPTIVDVRAPFYLDDKRMFDDGDLLIATFEKAEEGLPIVNLINTAVGQIQVSAREKIAVEVERMYGPHDRRFKTAMEIADAIRKG